jgi:hypothetical protein
MHPLVFNDSRLNYYRLQKMHFDNFLMEFLKRFLLSLFI